MGTEIRTFSSLKEITEFLTNQTLQYKGTFDDYSQWLGALLRDFAVTHKNDEWYQKTLAMQKTLGSKKPVEKTEKSKKGSKGKVESSCWVQTGGFDVSFTEEGQTQILFEAIDKITMKIQELEKFKVAVQQLSRLGLGANVSYLIYFEDDSPKKIVLKSKANVKGDEVFKFATELSVPAFYNFDGP